MEASPSGSRAKWCVKVAPGSQMSKRKPGSSGSQMSKWKPSSQMSQWKSSSSGSQIPRWKPNPSGSQMSKRKSDVQAEVRCPSGRQMFVRKPVQAEAVDHTDVEVSKCVEAACGS